MNYLVYILLLGINLYFMLNKKYRDTSKINYLSFGFTLAILLATIINDIEK